VVRHERYRGDVGLTPAQQRNAVSEGIALGLLKYGRDVLPLDRSRLDTAFETAWRTWPYRTNFPQVTDDLADGHDGVSAMTSADKKKHAWALYWDRDSGDLRIWARQSDWRADDPDDLAYATEVINGEVPLMGWEVLAHDFLAAFDD
jgi:hypothetical protein